MFLFWFLLFLLTSYQLALMHAPWSTLQAVGLTLLLWHSHERRPVTPRSTGMSRDEPQAPAHAAESSQAARQHSSRWQNWIATATVAGFQRNCSVYKDVLHSQT